MRLYSYNFILFFLLFFSQVCNAKHIMGGDITMKHLGAKGTYEFTLTAFIDNTEAQNSEFESLIYLRVYRKSDGSFLLSVPLDLKVIKGLTYANEACQRMYNFNASEFRYIGQGVMPDSFNEDGGYVFMWERCCRNNATNNIKITSSLFVGMLFYLETKPFFDKDGNEFINSTPDFKTPNGDFICIGDSFKMNMGAIDPDGDELRYSLVTPYRGFSSEQMPYGSIYTLIDFDNIPLIDWQPGFSATTAIPGPQPLNINISTGEIKVTTNQRGFFVFSVLVEEYRKGEKISSARRDFQLAVIDCLNEKPQNPEITYLNQPLHDLTGCPGTTYDLGITPPDPTLNYQWRLNGDNISGANTSSFRAENTGIYTVVATFKNKCAKRALSAESKISDAILPVIKISPKPLAFCEGKNIQISVKDSIGNTYEWLHNNQLLVNQTSSNLVVSTPGDYEVHVHDARYNCLRKDVSQVIMYENPRLSITSSSLEVCKEDEVILGSALLSPPTKSDTYQWYLNNQVLANERSEKITYQKKGRFGVEVTDVNGCKSTRQEIDIAERPSPTVDFDQPEVICGINADRVKLNGNPQGGTFIGAGVFNDYFVPSIAGAGSHPVTYKVKGNNGCFGTKDREIVVDKEIVLDLPKRFLATKDRPFKLSNKANRGDLSFYWYPGTGLDNDKIQIPEATLSIGQIYLLKVTSPLGCIINDTTKVYVSTVLYLPDAFTPNDDHINDSWEITNIDIFPDAEITIFDRWGETIFYSRGYAKAWDGTYNGLRVPVGAYVYQIITSDNIYRGNLSVIY